MGKGWEESCIFERKVELIGGSSDGLLLAAGVSR